MRHARPIVWLPFAVVVLATGSAAFQPPDPSDPPDQAKSPPAPAVSEPVSPFELTTPTPGVDVIVTLHSGQRIIAVFVARDERNLTVRIGAIQTRLPIDQIDRVVVQRPVIERYRSMRAVLDDADVERLLMLIEWLRVNHLYDEALAELSGVLELEPKNPEALRLKHLVEEQRRLRQRQVAPDHRTRKRSNRIVRPSERLLPGEFPLLSDEQVNLLKVWEINLDNPPRVLIDRATVDALLDRYSDDPSIPTTRDGREAFHRRAPIDILETMFRLRARDLYSKVRVLTMPDSLDRFRNDVNGAWLVNNCATTRCHGGVDAQTLLLYNRRPRAERSALTNLLILERAHLPDGRPLIDFDKPDRSPLLQLGLARSESAYPHPAVRGFKPVFRTVDSPRYQQAVNWILAMHRPRAELPIDYQPPSPKPTEPVKSPDQRGPQPR